MTRVLNCGTTSRKEQSYLILRLLDAQGVVDWEPLELCFRVAQHFGDVRFRGCILLGWLGSEVHHEVQIMPRTVLFSDMETESESCFLLKVVCWQTRNKIK